MSCTVYCALYAVHCRGEPGCKNILAATSAILMGAPLGLSFVKVLISGVLARLTTYLQKVNQ